MWWVYLLVFFGGAIVGAMLMALMAASRESEPHEVHVYCDEDGNMQIMTLPVEDKVIWHKKPEDIEKRIEQYEGTLEMVKNMNLHA
jgi:hypothetical protein